ncbi:hypothetical protein WA158_007343 [Blastocystis sp. Blastoise]
MSFRGGRGGNRGGRGGFSGGRGRGGQGNGGRRDYDEGPPDTVEVLGNVLHSTEGDLVCKCTNTKIPYFNAPVYLENKTKIGKVDEILGAINDVHLTVKCDSTVKAESFKSGDIVYINPQKLLPLSRFTEEGTKGGSRGGRGAGGRGGRGGAPRGGSFGGRGGSFGGRGGSFGGRGGSGSFGKPSFGGRGSFGKPTFHK